MAFREGVDTLETKTTFIDLMMVGFATVLVGAPWIFGFDSDGTATWNACLSGGAIAVGALAAFVGGTDTAWRRETSLGLGLWVALSPFVVGFVREETATLVHLLVGLALLVVAVTTLSTTPEIESRKQNSRKQSRRSGWLAAR